MRGFFLLTLVILAPASARAADDFRVVASSGEAAVWPASADAPSPAVPGLPLAPGDRLITGSGGRVEVAAPNGTFMRLEENGSLALGEATSRWSAFRLGVGRLVAKFAPSPGRPYRVSTPVAVAAIRGTELILDVADTGALQGGVVEGEVAFEPVTETEPAEGAAQPASGPWPGQTVTTAGGIVVEPNRPPRRLAEIPAPLVPAVADFSSIRERVPRLRAGWKELPPPQREALRRDAFRERIRWTVPPNLRDRVAPPAKRLKPSVGPAPLQPPRRRPTPLRRRSQP